MTPRDSHEPTLRRLVRDARAEQPAKLDWSRIEQRLLHEARRGQAPAARPARAVAWAVLAAAALVAIWLAGTRAPSSSPETQPALVAIRDPLHRDGDLMAVGTRVTSGELRVAVAHAGRAAWTLAADSSARLAGKGERITVALERGSVLSEVVPSPKPETFVVEAAGTRVAVHGTVFRVGLEGGRVIVQVSEGTVAVGPIGGAPGFLLEAPARGDFALDGRSGNIDGRPASRQTEERRVGPLKIARPRAPSATPTGSPPVPSSSAEPPNEPSINDIELGVARVVEVASDCFRSHTQSTDGVQITVRTALSLQIAGSGAVSNVGFQPPLSPDAERCAQEGISRIAFAPSQQGATVTRMLELKR
jgi:hypothetical protein